MTASQVSITLGLGMLRINHNHHYGNWQFLYVEIANNDYSLLRHTIISCPLENYQTLSYRLSFYLFRILKKGWKYHAFFIFIDNEERIRHFIIAPLDYECSDVYLQNCKATETPISSLHHAFELKLVCQKKNWMWPWPLTFVT